MGCKDAGWYVRQICVFTTLILTHTDSPRQHFAQDFEPWCQIILPLSAAYAGSLLHFEIQTRHALIMRITTDETRYRELWWDTHNPYHLCTSSLHTTHIEITGASRAETGPSHKPIVKCFYFVIYNFVINYKPNNLSKK